MSKSNYLLKAARIAAASLVLVAVVATPASAANGVRPANGVVMVA